MSILPLTGSQYSDFLRMSEDFTKNKVAVMPLPQRSGWGTVEDWANAGHSGAKAAVEAKANPVDPNTLAYKGDIIYYPLDIEIQATKEYAKQGTIAWDAWQYLKRNIDSILNDGLKAKGATTKLAYLNDETHQTSGAILVGPDTYRVSFRVAVLVEENNPIPLLIIGAILIAGLITADIVLNKSKVTKATLGTIEKVVQLPGKIAELLPTLGIGALVVAAIVIYVYIRSK